MRKKAFTIVQRMGVKWYPYYSKENKKNGWISEGGRVLYTKPPEGDTIMNRPAKAGEIKPLDDASKSHEFLRRTMDKSENIHQVKKEFDEYKKTEKSHELLRRAVDKNEDIHQVKKELDEHKASGKAPELAVDVTADRNGDGVTDAARVGVPAHVTPPPPAKIPRIKGLTGAALDAETHFAELYEQNPEKCVEDAIRFFEARAATKKDVITFGTDDVKDMSPFWNSRALETDLEARAKLRATVNVGLHQTANAVAKRAFLKHLDKIPKGGQIMVTVGGCGAGKGYALDRVPDAISIKKNSDVVWDSAGDQNATENPWILREARKRGLRVAFVYVDADPEVMWADPGKGVVQRAHKLTDGRMITTKVYADSYAIGARNHAEFAKRQGNANDVLFMYLDNRGEQPKRIDKIPDSTLNLDRKKLNEFAVRTVKENSAIAEHVRDAALMGERLWRD